MIPEFIKPFLWSYDTDKMNLGRDKKRIITNVLNWGTKRATDWLFENYNREDIKETILNPFAGEWNRKSLNYWALVLDVEPGSTKRKVPAE